jgi:hypothetical protein
MGIQTKGDLRRMFKNGQKNRLHKSVQTPHSYGTQQQDGFVVLRRETFLNAYKDLSLKKKETTFQIQILGGEVAQW